MNYVLHVADTAYSSWSLRGWLALHAFGLPFEHRLHRLYEPDMDAFRAAHEPARTVPALGWREGGEDVFVWDSLAIVETLAERHRDAGHWPEPPAARAAARALAAEMHSGFRDLRVAAPMNTHRRDRPAQTPPSDGVRADLARLEALWGWARGRWGAGGPYLFGAAFTAADAFFAPVAYRVTGYALPVAGPARAYAEALQAHPSVAAWAEMADADARRIDRYERI